jgi:hypothetical protein
MMGRYDGFVAFDFVAFDVEEDGGPPNDGELLRKSDAWLKHRNDAPLRDLNGELRRRSRMCSPVSANSLNPTRSSSKIDDVPAPRDSHT